MTGSKTAKLRRTALAGTVAALLTSLPAGAQYLRDAVDARELVCEFSDGFRRELVAATTRTAPQTYMLIYEGVTSDSAQALSTKRPGRKPARVRVTDRGVHLIEESGPSVRVTTLTGCEAWKFDRKGVERCVRFTARHAWHFDTAAYRDPDGAFARLPSGASAGACEPWRVD